MSIRRFRYFGNIKMPEYPDGEFVHYIDHAAEVERLTAEAYAVKCDRDGCMAALEKISAERDAAVARAERLEDLAAYVSSDIIIGQLTRIFGADQRELVELRRLIAALSPEPWGGPEGEEDA